MPFYGRQNDLLFCISVINRDVIALQNYNFFQRISKFLMFKKMNCKMWGGVNG